MKDYFKKKQVLEKINSGDENIFLQMYDFYAPKLFRHAYYRVNVKEVAEDITQQVFYKMWQYLLNENNKIDNVNAFLYQTTNNLITDYYRKAERKNIAIDEELENKLPAETSNNNIVDRNIEIEKIKTALTYLKPDQQKMITWRYLDDLSIKEISKISGKSKNAVYVNLHRSIKQLQNIIAKNYEKI